MFKCNRRNLKGTEIRIWTIATVTVPGHHSDHPLRPPARGALQIAEDGRRDELHSASVLRVAAQGARVVVELDWCRHVGREVGAGQGSGWNVRRSRTEERSVAFPAPEPRAHVKNGPLALEEGHSQGLALLRHVVGLRRVHRK